MRTETVAKRKRLTMTYRLKGGTVIGYYIGDALKYIEVRIYGEMFRCRYDIYYVSESLIYLVFTDIEYDMPYYMDGCTEEETISEFILSDQALFSYTDGLSPADEETADDYKVLIKDFERSLQEPVSKDEIIGMFNENYTVFESIVDYARKNEGLLNVYYYRNTREIISNSEARIEENVFSNIEVLLNDLYFYKVLEVSHDEIYFMRHTYGQGICYSSKPLDQESYDEIEEIGNGWYYYHETEPENPTPSQSQTPSPTISTELTTKAPSPVSYQNSDYEVTKLKCL